MRLAQSRLKECASRTDLLNDIGIGSLQRKGGRKKVQGLSRWWSRKVRHKLIIHGSLAIWRDEPDDAAIPFFVNNKREARGADVGPHCLFVAP